ncbi:hypothetical protein FE904_22370 [Chryseobacterium indologenes]|uniref:hypothetical protein n=1 Tax=Chryseobacterium indologenes TaxID=253 RepID=UPI00110923CD|nr:hypothetical protein [Chryseobacterium indologenes]TLX23342.1 hypothetical protein FE904_22370 [Chryseobacterium indologenes]
MNFAIVQHTDTNSNEKSDIVQNISNNLEELLKNKSYGSDIETFLIGFLCVKTKSGYEDWYKENKPKYIDYKKTKNRLTGEVMEIVKKYGYDIKFDYELYDEFVNASDEDSKSIFVKKLLESFSHLDKLPKKVQDFDKERFKTDVEDFFKEKGVI